MKKINITILFLLSSFIISCGFHLRGSQDLSAVLPEIQIQGISKHSELGRELIRALTSSKVNVLDESDTVLNITQNTLSKRVLSLDSAGRANQYELSYQLSFSLVKITQGEDKQKLVDLIPAQSIREKREYLFDANLVLAKADEEQQLNNDMREKVILQLMRRLNFSLKKANLNKK
jgi:LPS-assembly lipoprotein